MTVFYSSKCNYLHWLAFVDIAFQMSRYFKNNQTTMEEFKWQDRFNLCPVLSFQKGQSNFLIKNNKTKDSALKSFSLS